MRKTKGSTKYKWNGSVMKERRIELSMSIQALADAYNIAKILKRPISFFIEGQTK